MMQEYRTVNNLSELTEALLEGETYIKINFEDCSFLYSELSKRGVDLCNFDITNWDTSNVTNMWCMFWKAEKFNQPIGNWDVSTVTNTLQVYHMFRDCPISNSNKPKGISNERV